MSGLQPFPLTEPVPVDPAAIERGLAELWASADQAPSLGGAGAVVRSCTLNFAVVLSEQDQPSAVTDTVAALTLRHPCRIFLLSAAPQRPTAPIEASVSALCHLPAPGQPHICCEQITLTAAGTAVDGLAHSLLALLVPDVPLVVWWRGPAPLGTRFFDHLNDVGDRVVLDSTGFEDPIRDLPRLAAVLDSHPPYALADLTWTRLTRWRSFTAQFFDPSDVEPYLGRLDRVALRVAEPGGTAEAMLWLGWLASRLGWKPTAGRRDGRQSRLTFKAGPAGGGHEVHAEITAGSDKRPGLVREIALEASAVPRARFVLKRCDERTVEASLEGTEVTSLDRIVPLPVRNAAVLLSDELDLVARDHVYENALRAAAALASLLAQG